MISCIMPTADRLNCVPHAVNQFLAQTYPDKELIVLDSGNYNCERLVREHPSVKYVRTTAKWIGDLRNEAIRHTAGDVISHWDDDDLHHPSQLAYLMDFMTHNNADVVGINRPLFLDVRSHEMWSHIKAEYGWVHGSTLMFTREIAERFPFQGDRGQDRVFVRQCVKAGVIPRAAGHNDVHVNLIHEHNTSPKRTEQAGWLKEPTLPPWVWKAEYHEILTSFDKES